jgi:hypothetical protein
MPTPSEDPANPFDHATDPERHAIWERLVRADGEAFVAGDWTAIADDFDADCFEGIRCGGSADPARWQLTFADLPAYRASWLTASKQFRAKPFAAGSGPRDAIFARTHLDRIDIAGDRALCHKQFYGSVNLADGTVLDDRRQTLFRLHRRANSPCGWKIVGFLGQLPLDR